MKKLIVIGHKNPDTDSIVSAFAFSQLAKLKPSLFPWFSEFKLEPARSGELNRETKFIFQRFQTNPPAIKKRIDKKNVFLVDHNETSQSPDGWEKAIIFGFLDHHSIGDIKTSFPPFCHVEPIGSTATIIAKMFLNNKVPLKRKMAGLLLAAIISDTLKFTSPTTTREDRKIAKSLAKISKVDIKKLAEEMFQAKSDITGLSLAKIVGQDYKEFQSGGKIFGISVWETTNPRQIEEKQKNIISALKDLKEKNKLDLMFFSLVDILKNESRMFILGEEEKLVAEKAFRKKAKENLLFLPGVVSRKKQMAPLIKKALE